MRRRVGWRWETLDAIEDSTDESSLGGGWETDG